MGSIYDLPPEKVREFQDISEVYRSKRGVISAPELSKLIDLFKLYGRDVLRDAVDQCCLANWHFTGQIKRLCQLYVEFGRPRVESAIERLHGRQNFSQDMLEKILRDPKLAKHTEPLQLVKKSRTAYPTSEGIYDRYSASLWLSQKNLSNSVAYEYFEPAGLSDTNQQLLKLKPEYR